MYQNKMHYISAGLVFQIDWLQNDGNAEGGRELEGACLAPFKSFGVKESAYPE